VSPSVTDQLLTVNGTAAPSDIVSAIQSTGRDAILRGSGAPDSAAVCILETHADAVHPDERVRGLARMVQVAPKQSILDISLKGVSEGRYVATIRAAGDISRGPESVGGVWEEGANQTAGREGGGGIDFTSAETAGRGALGELQVSKSGVGSVLMDKPIEIWELIGRSVVVTRASKLSLQDPDTLVGVIARSAGVWDNDKTVCSCTGKTLWEERKEQVRKGML
jgi:copper chaperone for superoxide dismutase